MTSRSPDLRGFTLVELAMVLVIIALLAGGLLVPLGTQLDMHKRSETQRQLDEAKEALYGFALAHGYLPCPAMPGSASGLEARPAPPQCATDVGLLPWATLGTPRYDAYGQHLRYSVAPRFSNSDSHFSLLDVGNIRIKTRNAAGVESDATNGDVVAVVLSHGKNGVWGYGEGGQVADNSVTNSDEDVNGTGNGRNFYDRPPSDNGGPGGEFDDQLVWIPTSALLSRMVTARRLP